MSKSFFIVLFCGLFLFGASAKTNGLGKEVDTLRVYGEVVEKASIRYTDEYIQEIIFEVRSISENVVYLCVVSSASYKNFSNKKEKLLERLSKYTKINVVGRLKEDKILILNENIEFDEDSNL